MTKIVKKKKIKKKHQLCKLKFFKNVPIHYLPSLGSKYKSSQYIAKKYNIFSSLFVH